MNAPTWKPAKNLVRDLPRDLAAGTAVFFVALPLCLGIAKASGADEFSGMLAGIVGGIVVGILSGSQTNVAGPAAGLTAIVFAQIVLFQNKQAALLQEKLGVEKLDAAALESATEAGFRVFLLAVVIAGAFQIVLGFLKAGIISAFFPSSVIKGLLAAIGVILILKQFPHLLGHDKDPEGEMSFFQPDNETTFSELGQIASDFHIGAMAVGLLSLVVLLAWDRFKFLKRSIVPSPVIVVLIAVAVGLGFKTLGEPWSIGPTHLVQSPVANNLDEFLGFLRTPDYSQWLNPSVWIAAVTIALVASLETLLNLQAVDKLDPRQRSSPPNRELIAQGVGNVVAGAIGGIPLTSVVVRGSVNINAGARSKLSTIFHGSLLLGAVAFLPQVINLIPLSSLAAILIVTGFKLVNPTQIQRMFQQGRYQFIPFVVTLVAIVFTDLLKGIGIGMAVSVAFILSSNFRRPLRRIVEQHHDGEVLHIELANQVSFLNRAALEKILREAPSGGHVLIDASNTDYIDPDVLDLIRDFKEEIAPAHKVRLSLRGFKQKYQFKDEIQFADYSTRELQEKISAAQVWKILEQGNERFRTGHQISRDLGRQVLSTSKSQHPLAVVLSCIDSRSPAEIILDLGLGDIFSVRVAGNVVSGEVLGSMEYGCAVAGAKLILVLGHTRCGAVAATVEFVCSSQDPVKASGCQHIDCIACEIVPSIDLPKCRLLSSAAPEKKAAFADSVARQNVLRTVDEIVARSETIRRMVEDGRVAVVGAIYDIETGEMTLLTPAPAERAAPANVNLPEIALRASP